MADILWCVVIWLHSRLIPSNVTASEASHCDVTGYCVQHVRPASATIQISCCCREACVRVCAYFPQEIKSVCSTQHNTFHICSRSRNDGGGSQARAGHQVAEIARLCRGRLYQQRGGLPDRQRTRICQAESQERGECLSVKSKSASTFKQQRLQKQAMQSGPGFNLTEPPPPWADRTFRNVKCEKRNVFFFGV